MRIGEGQDVDRFRHGSAAQHKTAIWLGQLPRHLRFVTMT